MTIGILSYPDHIHAPLRHMLERFGVRCVQATDPEVLSLADGIIFTGSGEITEVHSALQLACSAEMLTSMDKPFLGINIGMQLLFDRIQPESTPLLKVIPGEVQSLKACACHSPNMGWHSLHVTKGHPLLKGISGRDLFYFAHSEFIASTQYTIAETTCENTFSAVVAKDLYMGVQFSPEKSGRAGSMVLQNFLELVQTKAADSQG